jgi:hypothetical protein
MLQGPRERSSDTGDQVVTHAWGKRTFVDGGGSVIKATAHGVEVDEVLVIQSTSGFHLPDDTDAEVHVISAGSDTNHPYALLSIPHTAQRKWKENAGGVQSPADGTRAIEVNAKRAYADDSKFATRGGVFEVDGNNIIIRGNVIIEGDLSMTGNLKVGGTLGVGGNISGGGALLTVPPSGPAVTTVDPPAGFDE